LPPCGYKKVAAWEKDHPILVVNICFGGGEEAISEKVWGDFVGGAREREGKSLSRSLSTKKEMGLAEDLAAARGKGESYLSQTKKTREEKRTRPTYLYDKWGENNQAASWEKQRSEN